jgi:hypothetical protein
VRLAIFFKFLIHSLFTNLCINPVQNIGRIERNQGTFYFFLFFIHMLLTNDVVVYLIILCQSGLPIPTRYVVPFWLTSLLLYWQFIYNYAKTVAQNIGNLPLLNNSPGPGPSYPIYYILVFTQNKRGIFFKRAQNLCIAA